MVVEGVMEEIATHIAQNVDVPIIGIGASADCDGQVLVIDDMLGMFERTPRFVKRYDDLAGRSAKRHGHMPMKYALAASRLRSRLTGRSPETLVAPLDRA